MIRRSTMLAVRRRDRRGRRLAPSAEARASASPAASGLQRLATVNASAAAAVAMGRTSDGRLHLVYQTFAGRGFSGLGSLSISRRCGASTQVQALAGLAGRAAGPPGDAGRLARRPCSARSRRASSRASGGSLRATAARRGRPRERPGRRPNEALAYGSDVTAAMTGSRRCSRSRRPATSSSRPASAAARRAHGHEQHQRVDDQRRPRGRCGDRRGRRELAVGRAQPDALPAGRRADRGSAAARSRPEPERARPRRPRYGPRHLRRVHDRRHARAPAPLRRRHGRGRLTQPHRRKGARRRHRHPGPHLGDVGRRLGRRRRGHPLEQGRDPLRADPAPRPERGQPLPDPGRRPPRPARPARRRDPERHRSRAARGDLPRARAAPPLGHGVGGQGR